MRILKDHIDKWFDYNFLIDTRTIMLADGESGEVDASMANNFIKAMHLLEQKEEPITVIMRTIGGDEFAGMAIYDAIKHSKCHVTIIVYGSAFSMGAVILQAADDRVMMPSSLLMCHDGNMSADDPIRTYENWAAMAKKGRRQMYEIFASRSGKTWKYWEKKCESDFIMTAEEALQQGLIDRVAVSPDS